MPRNQHRKFYVSNNFITTTTWPNERQMWDFVSNILISPTKNECCWTILCVTEHNWLFILNRLWEEVSSSGRPETRCYKSTADKCFISRANQVYTWVKHSMIWLVTPTSAKRSSPIRESGTDSKRQSCSCQFRHIDYDFRSDRSSRPPESEKWCQWSLFLFKEKEKAIYCCCHFHGTVFYRNV